MWNADCSGSLAKFLLIGHARLEAHPFLIQFLVSVVLIWEMHPDESYDLFLKAWTGHDVKHGAGHFIHGFFEVGGNFTIKLNDKAPRNETNKPALSCTNNLIGDSYDLRVRSAHL